MTAAHRTVPAGTPDVPPAPRAPLVAAVAGVVSFVTLVLALVLTGGEPRPAPEGLPDPGLAAAWGLRGGRLGMDLAAVLTVGCLLTGGVLLHGEPSGALGAAARRAVRLAGWCALGWVVAALVSFLLTVSDLTGTPPTELTSASLGTVAGTPQGRALLVAALLAAVVAVAARQVRTVLGVAVLAALSLAALVPVAAAGHAASTRDHDVAVNALAVHVSAAALWVGGLAGLVLVVRTVPAHLPAAARRFSPLALVGFVALGGSGVLVATTRVGLSIDAWTSGYGAVVAAKVGALVLLGVVGLWHRRRTLPRLDGGRPGAFLQLAGGELVLMAAATGLAAALARTPVPPVPEPAEPRHGGGHSTLPSVIDPVSLGELATAWRINAVLVLLLGVALACYLTGVRSLSKRGRRWPAGRTTAFAAGTLLGVVTTCSGLATYAPAMVSAQIAQLLLVLLPVPALLVLGAPVTLWLQVRGPATEDAGTPELPDSPVLRFLSDPFTGAVLACGLLLGLYRSPLIEESLSSSWVHLAVLLVALAAGLVLFWPVLAVDPAPGGRSWLESAVCVTAVVACLGLLALQLRYGENLLAGAWFRELRFDWVDPVTDQRLGGAIAGGAAVALLLVAAVPLLRPKASADSAPGRGTGPPATAAPRPDRVGRPRGPARSHGSRWSCRDCRRAGRRYPGAPCRCGCSSRR